MTFVRRHYLVGVELQVRDRGRAVPARLLWGRASRRRTRSGVARYYYGARLVWNARARGSRQAAQARARPPAGRSRRPAVGRARGPVLRGAAASGGRAASRTSAGAVEVPKRRSKPRRRDRSSVPAPSSPCRVRERARSSSSGPKKLSGSCASSGTSSSQVVWFSDLPRDRLPGAKLLLSLSCCGSTTTRCPTTASRSSSPPFCAAPGALPAEPVLDGQDAEGRGCRCSGCSPSSRRIQDEVQEEARTPRAARQA